MKFKVRNRMFFATILLLIVVSIGCANNISRQYLTAARNFNDIYFKVIECIDISNKSKSIELLQSKDFDQDFKKLEELMNVIRDTIPENKKIIYNNFRDRYDELTFLRSTSKDMLNMSIDDRRKISNIFVSIEMNKARWKDKSSSVVWE